jgi:hypothetical protein
MPNDLAEIELKLMPNRGGGHGCTVCGRWIEHAPILATDADQTVAVCGDCLESGDIDGRLALTAERREQRADEERAYAAHARSLIGRLKVPTFTRWQNACKWANWMDQLEYETDQD